MPWYYKLLLIYILGINLFAAAVTIYDKRHAIKGKRRISEAALLKISALGGAPLMYATMKLIRHKTQKNKFMIGIPLIFFAEVAFVIFLIIKF